MRPFPVQFGSECIERREPTTFPPKKSQDFYTKKSKKKTGLRFDLQITSQGQDIWGKKPHFEKTRVLLKIKPKQFKAISLPKTTLALQQLPTLPLLPPGFCPLCYINAKLVPFTMEYSIVSLLDWALYNFSNKTDERNFSCLINDGNKLPFINSPFAQMVVNRVQWFGSEE